MAVTTADGIVTGVDEEGLRDWFNVARQSMLGTPLDADTFDQHKGKFTEPDRCITAVDDRGGSCGSAYAFSTELTVPGGSVAAAAVTAVGVLPTHRRQGHLTRMMRAQLADVAERGEPVAVLVAAEYPIYSRYGYGPATEACGLHIDAAALSGRPQDGLLAPATGSVELVDNDAFYKLLPGVYDRARVRHPGHISWQDSTYQIVSGLAQSQFGTDNRETTKVTWSDQDGVPQAAVAYTLRQNWQGNRPLGVLTADPLIAATDEAERELIRFLVNVDWIAGVDVNLRPVDDPFPLSLRDGRVAELVDHSDHVWVRLLDVPAALMARRYQARGALVIQVEDPMGFATGRFLLDVAADVAEDGSYEHAAHPARVEPTDAEPDLTVPVWALGAAYLGGLSWSRLTGAGLVDEHRPGAVAHASAMFTTPRAPWCAMTF
jgi:predicted acetyltransferase